MGSLIHCFVGVCECSVNKMLPAKELNLFGEDGGVIKGSATIMDKKWSGPDQEKDIST